MEKIQNKYHRSEDTFVFMLVMEFARMHAKYLMQKIHSI